MEEPSFQDEMTIAIIATDFNKDVDFSDVPLRNTRASAPIATKLPDSDKDSTEVGKVEEAIKKSTEEKNSSVLPSFLRKKLQEKDAVEVKQDEPVKQNVASENEDDEPVVLPHDADSF